MSVYKIPRKPQPQNEAVRGIMRYEEGHSASAGIVHVSGADVETCALQVEVCIGIDDGIVAKLYACCSVLYGILPDDGRVCSLLSGQGSRRHIR